ncbi:ferredoxin [Candidatus Woesearchaeota archaeon]|nr:ferredoxin [Candidatus Woesearchaeota archaeon]
MGKKYKIIYHRKGCIGAGACEAIAPELWLYEIETSLATLKDPATTKTADKEELIIDEKDFPKHLEAAQVCPVNIIEIYDLETGEKIYPK